jgi:toxin ParE1/3/4
MSYKIIVSPIASKNIENAVSYYIEEVSKKVANDFLKDFRKTYKSIQKKPILLVPR